VGSGSRWCVIRLVPAIWPDPEHKCPARIGLDITVSNTMLDTSSFFHSLDFRTPYPRAMRTDRPASSTSHHYGNGSRAHE
jgi:hypothetical protein